MSLDYQQFLEAKMTLAPDRGFAHIGTVNPMCKPHQVDIIRWAVRKGRAAIFAAFGLGKSFMQLEIARLVMAQARGRFLIVAPLGVRQEFIRDAAKLGIDVHFIRRIEECEAVEKATARSFAPNGGAQDDTARREIARDGGWVLGDGGALDTGGRRPIYITNYETVRDGKLDLKHFVGASLDEASILRGFGGTKTFREFMRMFDGMRFKFVATATPSPNDYIELLAYAAFLEVMDVGQAKTRFFKRDSEKADALTLLPHKEREFWLWVSSWAVFLQKPSDLGYSDDGYVLPDLEVHWHELSCEAAELRSREADPGGQCRLIGKAGAIGLAEAAREKRESLDARLEKLLELRRIDLHAHRLLWHDLESERKAIEKAVPDSVSVYGSQELDEREQAIIDFSEGRIAELAAKPVIAGSGCNFQRHCHWAIFFGIGFKFNDFIQAVHRIQRFQQTHKVRIDLIYTEAERPVREILERKWELHETLTAKMTAIIRQYGLAGDAQKALERSIGVDRVEAGGQCFKVVRNDTVLETRLMETDSVHLLLTSIPFSTQYEYTPSYNDFGHSDSNVQFFEQLDYLTPELLRILKPGRVAAIHVKDRIVPGGMTGLGFQTVYPFSDQTIAHFVKHGFAFLGRKTIVTDVVRENNQTYRLGWSEQCKDGSRMGAGMPEYLLLFRKPQTDRSKGYADEPVEKRKDEYSRSRWQIDAHGFMRSSGNRLLTAEDLDGQPHERIFKLFREYSLNQVYDYERHVGLSETLETCGECGHIHVGPGGTCIAEAASSFQLPASSSEAAKLRSFEAEKQTQGPSTPVSRAGENAREPSCAQDDRCACTGAGRLPVTFMLLPPQSWHPDVWSDITRMLSLNSVQAAKGQEKHLCPLQFDIVDRVISQFSMKGETVHDPFGGLMTVPYRAVLLGRYGSGCELNGNYFADGVEYCRAAEKKVGMPSLFALDGEESGEAAEPRSFEAELLPQCPSPNGAAQDDTGFGLEAEELSSLGAAL